jgi:predicted RNA-binding protein with RPS1 domain
VPPSQKKSKKEAEAEVVPEVEKKSLPAVGSVVRGYVKSASTRGLFVALSRSVDAYARLCNLAETFVTEPAASFPAGMLVTARVMSVDGRGRVEVKLTTSHACTLSVLSLSHCLSHSLSLCLSHCLSHTLSLSLTHSLAVSLSHSQVTLKMEQPVGVAAGGALAATRAAAIAALTVGQTVWGDVRKLESFGTFIQLDGPGARP